MVRRVEKLIFPMLLLCAWFFISQQKMVDAFLLPSPITVGESLITGICSGHLQTDVLISLRRVLYGFSLSFFLAFPLGILTGRYRGASGVIEGILNPLRCVPPLSLAPLLILWIGIGEGGKIAVIVLASFFPLFINVRDAFIAVPVALIEVGRVGGFSRFRTFLRIMLPCALPGIFTGVKIALGYSWRALIAAEMIAASSGIGYRIFEASRMSSTADVFAGIFVIAFVGSLMDYVLGIIALRMKKFGGIFHESV